MSVYPSSPPSLQQAEFVTVRFVLEVRDDGLLTVARMLSLRKTLRFVAGEVLGNVRARRLFDPPPSSDPVAVRRFQKPAPAFVIKQDWCVSGELREGDRIVIDLLLLGDGLSSLEDMVLLFSSLGDYGLDNGNLHFDLVEIQTLDHEDRWQTIRQETRRRHQPLTPIVLRLDHWLDRHWPQSHPVSLEFTTPLRLVAGGRILRRPDFSSLFPFLLRRVTSMLHAHCGLEPVPEPGPLLQSAATLRGGWDEVRWIDWRETGGDELLGGLTGTLHIEGDALDEVLWIILLASLFGAGKGAAYGAGRFSLLPNG